MRHSLQRVLILTFLTELGARETVFYKPAAPNGASAMKYIVFHPSQNFLALRLRTRVRRKRAENPQFANIVFVAE